MSLKLHAIALGCQMSAADASEMSDPFKKRGFTATADIEEADAVLVSTCTVRQHAEDRALSLIGRLGEWKARDPKRIVIVSGCAAERLSGWLEKRFPFLDLVVGAKSIEQYPRILEQALGARFDALAEDRKAFPESLRPLEPSPVSAFVTIMRGCNYSCAYCIVPAVRGRELYRPVEDILSEVRAKVAAGAKEAMLLGQTVNSYASGADRFPGLLRLLDRVPGLLRIRFMSPHPHYLDEGMIAAMAECKTVCPSLHMPVQSGSDRVLKLMRRNYTRGSYLAKISALKKAVASVVLTTDIIVGFPTETEEEFAETLALLEELKPASAYCFKYSPRESTESAGWADDVPDAVKEDRLKRLNAVVDRLIAEGLQGQVGRTVEVLTEEPGFGKTREGFKVKLDEAVPAGELARARITAAARLTLLGEIS